MSSVDDRTRAYRNWLSVMSHSESAPYETTVRPDLVAFAQTMSTDDLRASVAANQGIDRAAVAAALAVLATRV